MLFIYAGNMQKSQQKLFLLGLMALSGCATILEPPKQTISINSDPPGAVCDVTRAGKPISTFHTPGEFTVAKSHNNLIIRCQKPGYAPVTGVDESHNAGWIFGNMVIGTLIGTIVDLSTSADDVYGESIRIKMHKLDKDDPDVYRLYRLSHDTDDEKNHREPLSAPIQAEKY